MKGLGGSSGGHARSKPGRGAKLKFSYDPNKDILEIENVRYSGELFRKLAQTNDDGATYRLIQDESGVVIIKRETEE
jgi:hypothetical protein